MSQPQQPQQPQPQTTQQPHHIFTLHATPEKIKSLLVKFKENKITVTGFPAGEFVYRGVLMRFAWSMPTCCLSLGIVMKSGLAMVQSDEAIEKAVREFVEKA